ncbi:MAG: hypothetical protein AMXMBFR84_39950 [Candidatus Hydrogenedentota bacterium]
MKHRFVLPVLMICSAIVLSPVQAQESTPALPDSVRAQVDAAVARVKPALVRIHVVWTEYSEGREVKYEASGSGAIIREAGYVITNHHVAGHATRIFCTMADREVVEGELVGTDAMTDIAVIKLENPDGRKFPVAQFGDSDAVRVGDTVMSMGSPMALSQSVTLGIVSNNELVMPYRDWGGFTLDGEDVGSLVRWIGHDADIYGGNSGGPLVNLAGEIVGINEISIGLGGAIPGNLAKSVAEELMERGSVQRAWIGVSLQPQLRHVEDRRGVLVQSAIEGSPADAAGFQSGDIMLSIDGHETNARFEEQIPIINLTVANLTIGKAVPVVVLRDGNEVTLTVTPAEREKVMPKEREFKRWGITVQNLSYVLAKTMKRANAEGALVTSVRPGGPVGDAKPSMQRADVIVAVNGTPIKSIEELDAFTEEFVKDKTAPAPVLVEFERKTQKLVTVVKVGIKDLPDPGRAVKKAWLPVATQVITRDMATQIGNNGLKGFRITQVYPHTTAEAAGLQVGDLIYAVDGIPLEADAPEDYEELATLIRQYEIGTTAQLNVLRQGEKIAVPVELKASPDEQREMKEYEDLNFEFKGRDITFFDRVGEKWSEEQAGVLVTEVTMGGWAAIGGLDVGDLILEVDSQTVANVEGIETLMAGIAEKQPKAITVKVLRGIYAIFLELEPNWTTTDVVAKEN